ncbi:ROK family protein [Mycobacterium sp. NPDC003449]
MTAGIGVDLGGTKTAAGLVLSGGEIELDCTATTPAGDGPEAIVATVIGLVADIRDRARRTGLPDPIAIGIGSAGVIDGEHGTVLSATEQLTDWAGTPLGRMVAAGTGLPVRVTNDVHAHAIGEARYGAGRGLHTLLMVAAGTGIGGSFVIDGVPVAGAHWAAGHLGHIPSPEADGLECTCGRSGHLEAIASGPGLLELYRRRGGTAADTRRLTGLAESGDPLASECVTLAARALGRAVGGWVNMLDPDAVILSGGLAGSGALWWSEVTDAATEQVIDAVEDCPLLPAQRGTHAAVLGAAAFGMSAIITPTGDRP